MSLGEEIEKAKMMVKDDRVTRYVMGYIGGYRVMTLNDIRDFGDFDPIEASVTFINGGVEVFIAEE